MPLYEFRCPKGHDFERFYRSIGAARAEEQCPECGAMAARRISAAGLVFKGSGFYITDYGKDGKKAERAAAEASSKPAAEKAGTTDSGGGAEKSSPKPDGGGAATDKPPAPSPPPSSATTTKKAE